MEIQSMRDEEASLESRAFAAMQPEFIEKVIYPIVRMESAGRVLSSNGEASLVQDRGTGRVTVSYRFGDENLFFGKLYSDWLGPHCFEVLKGLWRDGFGSAEPYQVSKPLLYLPDLNFLLTKAAEGGPLTSFIGQDNHEVRAHAHRSARWLVRLHRSPLRVGQRQSLWDSLKLFRIARRLTKATGRIPAERKNMTEMVKALCDKAKQNGVPATTVQTHGRFHAEHIYVRGEATTLIDFDRSLPADPARDLAEFVMVLRNRTFKQTGSTATAEAPLKDFFEEYLSSLPQNTKNLGIYWGAFLLLNLFGKTRKKGEPEAFERAMRFYLSEFELALSEKLVSAG